MVRQADVLLFLDVLAVLVLLDERRLLAKLDPGALLAGRSGGGILGGRRGSILLGGGSRGGGLLILGSWCRRLRLGDADSRGKPHDQSGGSGAQRPSRLRPVPMAITSLYDMRNSTFRCEPELGSQPRRLSPSSRRSTLRCHAGRAGPVARGANRPGSKARIAAFPWPQKVPIPHAQADTTTPLQTRHAHLFAPATAARRS